MRRTRIANVAFSTTANLQTLPFTGGHICIAPLIKSGQRLQSYDANKGTIGQNRRLSSIRKAKGSEHYRTLLAAAQLQPDHTGSVTQDGGSKPSAGIVSDNYIVSSHEELRKNPLHSDGPPVLGQHNAWGRSKEYESEMNTVHRLYSEIMHTKKIQDSGCSHVSLSVPKERLLMHEMRPEQASLHHFLSRFNSFWTGNFALLSAQYNLAYPQQMRTGRIVINEVVAERVGKLLVGRPGATPDERLPSMVEMWCGNSLFQTLALKRHWWPTILLWLLRSHPDMAAPFLLATYTSPYPPFYMVTDALEYLASHHLQAAARGTQTDVEFFRFTVFHLLNHCIEIRPELSQKSIYLLLTRSNLEQTINFYATLQALNTSIGSDTLLHFAYCFAGYGEFERSLSALHAAILAGADLQSSEFLSTCNQILRCSAAHPNGYHASSYLVSRLLEMGAQINLAHYNVLLLNAVESGDMPTALRIFHLLEDNNVQPDPFTYSILLKGCKESDDRSLVAGILRKADEACINAQNPVLGASILHCEYIQHSLQAASKQDPQSVFNNIVLAYRKYFDPTPLIQLGIMSPSGLEARYVERMQPPSAAIHIVLIAYLRAADTSDQILRVYNNFVRLIEKGAIVGESKNHIIRLALKDTTWNSFLLAFSHDKRNLKHCTSVIHRMGQGIDERWLPRDPVTNEVLVPAQPTVQTWSILLHAFARHGQTAAAEKVLDLMRQKGLKPNDVTWNSLIKGYSITQDLEGMAKALRVMEREGWNVDQYTVGSFGRIEDRAKLMKIWEEMTQTESALLEGEQLDEERPFFPTAQVVEQAKARVKLLNGLHSVSDQEV